MVIIIVMKVMRAIKRWRVIGSPNKDIIIFSSTARRRRRRGCDGGCAAGRSEGTPLLTQFCTYPPLVGLFRGWFPPLPLPFPALPARPPRDI